MQFDKNKPIYVQIENFIRDKILQEVWPSNERIPSVRELAEVLEVNPNTIMKCYERLEREQIIYNQRGVGFFVDVQARQNILQNKKQNFYQELPGLFKAMQVLQIDMSELTKEWEKYCNSITSNT